MPLSCGCPVPGPILPIGPISQSAAARSFVGWLMSQPAMEVVGVLVVLFVVLSFCLVRLGTWFAQACEADSDQSS